jgi:hypothetical protein
MKYKTVLTAALFAATLSSASQAQHVTINRQDFGTCAGSPWSTFAGWLAIAAGRVCSEGLPGEGSGTGTVDWTFVNGTVDFKGVYFSGSGTFFLDVMDANNVIHTTRFEASGTNVWVGIDNAVADAARIRIRRETGVGSFGLADVAFDPATHQGNGPDGNGPPGNGPHGSGPPGLGPAGNGPPGVGPDGNGPPGPPDNNGNANDVGDELEDLVNQTNATPEPATLILVASGLGGVGALMRRRKRRNDQA